MDPDQFMLLVMVSVSVLLVVILGRFLYKVFWDKAYFPIRWKDDLEKGLIPVSLISMEKQYPDKVRFFAYWFLIDRLRAEGIAGDFAEAGVYKGETARLMHHADPSRRLHLFDTFSGFRKDDLLHEKGKAATYGSKHFSDTSVEKVLKIIGGNDNIIIHKGDISETLKEIPEARYALVSLDLDLYLPTAAALEYFYSRLSPGGIILVHDYNERWPGIIQAIREVEEKVPESFILLPDMDTTAVLAKNR